MLAAADEQVILAMLLAIMSMVIACISLLLVLRKHWPTSRDSAGIGSRAAAAKQSGKKSEPKADKVAAALPGAKRGPFANLPAEAIAELTAATIAEINRAARERYIRLLLLGGSVVLCLGLAEISLRYFAGGQLHLDRDERILMYRYDPTLGWFPVPNSHERSGAAQEVTVTHNAEGFRDWEHTPSAKPAIAFLGDSFVWGYDVEASERFTDKLQAKHTDWDVFNFGVSGYGTDQELLLLERIFDQYKPHVVFLVFSTETDGLDNATNVRYGGYYKPYFTVGTNHLQLNGVPVPRGERVFWSEHPAFAASYMARLAVRAYYKAMSPPILTNRDPTGALIREMQTFVLSKGAELFIGLTRRNANFEEYLRRLKIPFVDLSTSLRFPEFGQHWTPAGHTFVAERIDQFLRGGSYLSPNEVPSTP